MQLAAGIEVNGELGCRVTGKDSHNLGRIYNQPRREFFCLFPLRMMPFEMHMASATVIHNHNLLVCVMLPFYFSYISTSCNVAFERGRS